jgi:hypothetical protein
LQVGGGGIFSNGPLSLFAPATTTTFASSNSLLSISHATGTFSGTGILLDFATSTYNTASPGTFTGNFFKFNTGGVTKFIANAAGFLGVGTSTPNWLTQVNGTTSQLALSNNLGPTNGKHWLFTALADGSFQIGTSSDLLNASTSILTVSPRGFVGLGTTSPGATFSIDTSAPTSTYPMALFGHYAAASSSQTILSVLSGTTTKRQITSLTGVNPTIVGTLAQASGKRAKVVGRYAYTAINPTFYINDISNRKAPTQVGSIDMTGSIGGLSGFDVSGRYAYVVTSSGQGSLAVVDISVPATPKLVSFRSLSGIISNASDIVVSGRYAYVANSTGGTLAAFDISNPDKPVAVGTLSLTSSFTSNMVISGNYLYGVQGFVPAIVTAIDISNPTNLQIAGTVSFSAAFISYLDISGKYLYASGSTYTLAVFDISNPAAISTTRLLADSGYTAGLGLAVAGKYAYVGASGKMGVYDISDPANPVNMGFVNDAINFTAPFVISGRNLIIGGSTNLAIADLPGFDVPTLLAGAVETGDLKVADNASIGLGLTVSGPLTVGSAGIFSNGGLILQAPATTTSSNLNLLSLNQATGTFAGNAINLEFATSSFNASNPGIFTGNFFKFSIGGVTKFIATAGGNLGIGTSSPYAALSVVGQVVGSYFTATSTTASSTFQGIVGTGLGITGSSTLNGLRLQTLTVSGNSTSTFANGIDLSDGCFSVKGTCVGGGTAGGSGTVNSGTLNQLAYYTGATAVSASAFLTNLDSATKFGVGTTSPFWSLQVSSTTGTQFAISNQNAPTNGKHWLFTALTDGSFQIGTSSDLLDASSTLITIGSSGDVAIGTTTANTNARLTIADTDLSGERLRLSGQEFFQAGNTDTNGISFLAGVNRSNNRQLWIGDSNELTKNTTNYVLRAIFANLSGPEINAISTDGTVGKNLFIDTDASPTVNVGIGSGGDPLSKLSVTGNLSVGSYAITTPAPTNGFTVSGAGGFGTSSPFWNLQVASTTGTQFAITNSNGPTNGKHWLFTALADGRFQIGTSSDLLNASTSIISIAQSGTTTLSKGLVVSGGIRNTNLDCSALNNGGKITALSDGSFICSDDAGAAASLSGTGVANKIAFWTSATALSNNTLLSWNDTANKFGIGTSTPFWELQVATSSPQLALTNPNATTNGKHWLFTVTNTGGFNIGTSSDLLNSTSTYFTINDQRGQVGIGTTTPFARLAVNPVAGDLNQFVVGSSTATSFIIDSAGRVGVGTSTPGAKFAVTANSSTTAVYIDQRDSTGGLLTLQQAGVDRFSVANSGALTISTTGGDVVKTSTGTTNSTDFNYTGSQMTHVTSTSTNGVLEIETGQISGEGSIGASSPSVTTQAAVRSGGQVILRDDGKYVIIHGGTTATASLWNGTTTGAMSTTATNPAITTTIQAGSIALKRPDGRYLVVHGGVTTGDTSLFDPYGITATAAGPDVCASGAAATGTNAVLRPDGRYFIMCGGLAVTSVYDPTANSVIVGPANPGGGSFGAGAHALQRDDGTFLVFLGGNTATTYIYNPGGGDRITQGTTTAVTITNAPTITTGAFSIRRADGTFLVVPGAANSSYIYDPVGTASSPYGTFTQLSGAGNGPSVTLADGAQAVWRQDGNYLLLIGQGSQVTNIIKPGASSGNIFVTSGAPTLSAAAGFGVTAFMMPNGKYAIVLGGGSTNIDYYDTNFIIGGESSGSSSNSAFYESECIDNTNLNENSTVNWTANSEGKITVETRTVTSPADCSTGTYATTTTSGDKIKLTSTTDNRVQIRVTFKRDFPVFIDQEWGIRKAGLTRYRRTNKDPALYDVSISNGAALHRTQFDFGISTATSGPVSVNIVNDKDKQLAIALAAGFGYGSATTTTAGGGGLYLGSFQSNPVLTTTAASGTVVMKRPDGKFVVISGNMTTANAQLFDPTLRTFTALGTTPATTTGAGAFAWKRPDGKFLIGHGASSTLMSIFDPVTNTFTSAPGLYNSSGLGEGSQVLPLPTGRLLIIHGNYSTITSIYDPIQNTMIEGPRVGTVVGAGSVLIPRPDGTYLLMPGVTTEQCTLLPTVTYIFDPYTMVFNGNSAVTSTGTGPGAFAFQRKDGLWIIVKGGATAATCVSVNTTMIYNPNQNRIAAGPTLSAATSKGGAHAIPRPDGTWLVIHGGRVTTTSIYREEAGAFTTEAGGQVGVFLAGPALITAPGAGSVSFQTDDGYFTTITGNAGTVVQRYNGGWVAKGTYRTEAFNLSPVGTKLTTDSTLVWRGNTFTGISAEVKTASTQDSLQNTDAREVAKSGALINPQASDTWLQINFNFSRTFPSYGRAYTDVWYGSGAGTITFLQRTIATPVLYEYSVTKDKDLIDLQSDGLSMFRVSSTGDVYTASGGSVNTSGADLAERYTSSTELHPGDVVAIDPTNNHGVMLTKYQYQPDVLGVVSTDPGFIAGAYTKDSYPIALVGRVPVKVSTENGMIRSGDYLTAASVPGYAMKARLSGRVIGKALESLDASKLTDCPASDFPMPGRKCGTIMMFVNLIDYGGQSVDLAMSEWNAAKTGQSVDATATTTDSGITLSDTTVVDEQGIAFAQTLEASTHEAAILAFLEEMKAERAKNGASQSELFTDKVSAISQIISPYFLANLLQAKEIEGVSVKTQTIEASSISTNSIGGKETGATRIVFTTDGKLVIYGKIRVASTTTATASSTFAGAVLGVSSTTPSTDVSTTTASSTDTAAAITALIGTPITEATTTDGILVSFDQDGNAYFGGDLVAKSVTTSGLTVNGVAAFSGGLSVETIGLASSTLALLSDTTFFGRPYFTADTGGSATVAKGARSVDITFDRDYVETPVVNATMVFNGSATSSEDDTSDAIFKNDIRYVVTKRNTHGFTIILNKNAPSDVSFSWIAFAIKDGKAFTSRTAQDALQDQPVVEIQTGAGGGVNLTSTTTDTTTPPATGGSAIDATTTDSGAVTPVDSSSGGGVSTEPVAPIPEVVSPPIEIPAVTTPIDSPPVTLDSSTN